MKQKCFKCEIITWNKVWRLSRNLAFKVKESDFKPDILIAIGRGGWMPARILSDYLHLPALASIKIEHYFKGARMQAEAVIKYPLNTDVRGMNVLVVDDVSDTGDTLMVALDHIKNFSPSQVKFAVLHHKQVSKFVPHFYAARVIKWRWIIYPWAIVEDISDFIGRMENRPKSIKGLMERLKNDYGISVSMQTIEDVLKVSDIVL